MMNLNRDFFTDRNRALFALIENDLIEFKEGEAPHFVVREKLRSDGDLQEKLGLDQLGRKYVPVYIIDDFLGNFEDLGSLVQQNLVSTEMAYEWFSYYIETCCENVEIQRYIRFQRATPENEDVYDKLDYIYKECRRFGSEKLQKK